MSSRKTIYPTDPITPLYLYPFPYPILRLPYLSSSNSLVHVDP